jgi:SAM-dependent methyltransferase
MAQNIYDNDKFFAGYAQLPRSQKGLDGAPEWPSLRAMLPELRGRKVLDLGCGYGWFCRWAREQGAAKVIGLDVSEKMLARARKDTPDTAITYAVSDLDTAELAGASFDLIYSSLTFHYIADLERLLRQIHDALIPGGRFVFSAEHPIYTAPIEPGWSTTRIGGKCWPVDRYLVEGPRSRDWLAKGVVKYHRTLGTWVNTLLRVGFEIVALDEFRPSDAQIAALPSLAEELERPMFFLMSVRR